MSVLLSKSSLVAIMLFLSSGSVLTSSDFRLRMPIDCTVGVDCHIQNFFDHDPGPGFRDYACGFLGYDGHDGTDLRLPNLAAMRRGVPVLAAAPGTVRAIRDAMPDVSIRDGGVDAIRGREAGNAVVLRHGPDWETQYSHLLRGSVRVRPGDAVEAGDVLGLVGLSGKTEFPHVHFEVRHQGEAVDPFVGLRRGDACGVGIEPLWDAQVLRSLAYRPTGLLKAGFATREPDAVIVEAGGEPHTDVSADAPALVFWVEVFGARKGDRETLRIVGPDGQVVTARTKTIAGNKARWMSYVGRRLRGTGWPAGTYRGTYRLERADAAGEETVLEISRSVTVR